MSIVASKTKMEMLSKTQETLTDLTRVGRSKPMGYLPLGTLRDEGVSVDEAIAWAQSKELAFLVADEIESGVWQGAIYVWHRLALLDLLMANQQIAEVVVPDLSVLGFVLETMALVWSQEDHPDQYELIGLAYADKRFTELKYCKRPK